MQLYGAISDFNDVISKKLEVHSNIECIMEAHQVSSRDTLNFKLEIISSPSIKQFTTSVVLYSTKATLCINT